MKALLLPLLVLILAACSGTPPRIHNSDWMPVYTKDLSRGGIYEELDFFVQLEDEDGLEDISEISIHRDDRGWAWKLNQENWVSLSKDGENWVGASGLCRDGGIPDGEYRLKVTDRSGQSVESLFEYTSPALDTGRIRFPHAAAEKDDRIRIDGGGREPLLLWFYSEKGDFLYERYLSPGLYLSKDLEKNKQKEKPHWFMIYYRDEEGGYGLKSGPFLINPQVSASVSATSGDS